MFQRFVSLDLIYLKILNEICKINYFCSLYKFCFGDKYYLFRNPVKWIPLYNYHFKDEQTEVFLNSRSVI